MRRNAKADANQPAPTAHYGPDNGNWRHGRKVKGERVCSICGSMYLGVPASKYCSRECMGIAYRHEGHPQFNNRSLEKECAFCGKLFWTESSKPEQKYCSRWCYGRDTIKKGKMKKGQVFRKDDNQNKIVKALESAGCSVLDLSSVGGGCPDIAVGLENRTILMEIKNPETGGKLSKRQIEWHEKWNGQVAVVYTVDDALKAIGAIE